MRFLSCVAVFFLGAVITSPAFTEGALPTLPNAGVANPSVTMDGHALTPGRTLTLVRADFGQAPGGTSGATLCLRNGTCIWSGEPTFSNGVIVGGTGTFAGFATITNPGNYGGTGIAGTTLALNTYPGTQTGANAYIYPDYNTIANTDFGSFGDTNTHFGFVIGGGKSVSPSNTTGSWQIFRTAYNGYGGGSTASFLTASQSIVAPGNAASYLSTYGSSYNVYGNFTGSNPECIIPQGMQPTSCVGEEIDVGTGSAVTNIREGLRIVDTGSSAATYGANTDAAIGVMMAPSTGIGFKNGLMFGDIATEGSFPIAASGHIFYAVGSSVVLNNIMDFSALTSKFTYGAFVLPPNNLEFCFGSPNNCSGGAIYSSTATNGGNIAFVTGGVKLNGAVINGGAAPSNSGTCAITGQAGGNTTGAFAANGACAGGTIKFTFAATAASGWACTASDASTPSNTVKQTGYTTTTATFTANIAASDIITFNCVGF